MPIRWIEEVGTVTDSSLLRTMVGSVWGVTMVLPSPTGQPAHPLRTITHMVGRELDLSSVSQLRARLQDTVVAHSRVLVDCTAVHAIEPVGAGLLWQLAVELEQRFGGTIRLIHLSFPMMNRLRNHPLKRYVSVGEELFQDPFFSPDPSHR